MTIALVVPECGDTVTLGIDVDGAVLINITVVLLKESVDRGVFVVVDGNFIAVVWLKITVAFIEL